MKIVDDIEKAWAEQNYNQLASYARRLRDPDLRGLPPHVLSFLGVGAAIASKPRIAMRPLWFAYQKQPGDINNQLNLGNCLKDLEDYRGALEVYLADGNGGDDDLILLGAGICYLELGEVENARLMFERSLSVNGENKVARLNYGRALYRLEQIELASQNYQKALELDTSYAPAAINLSVCAIRKADFNMGVSLAEQVLDSGYWNDDYLRTLLSGAMQVGAAKIAAHFFEKYGAKGSPRTKFVAAEVYRYGKVLDKAEVLCRQVIAGQKDFFSAYIILAHSLAEQGKVKEAEAISEAGFVRCDPMDVPPTYLPNPWTLFAVKDDPSLQLKVASRYAEAAIDSLPRKTQFLRVAAGAKKTVAYISPDFGAHPVSECMLPVFSNHSRDLLETHAFSLRLTHDSVTEEIKNAVDEFHDCQALQYPELLKLSEDIGVDVLVDLAVYTGSSRPNHVALGLAPLQVNHLGYSGTSGAKGYDVIVADDFIIPKEFEKYYSEKVLRLKYPIVSSGMRDTSHLTPQDRAANGLPQEGVVFGCLANPYKFSQKILAAWAEILKAVPDGVLLLGVMAPDALRGVQVSLERLGVARSRVIQSVFQPTRDEHFARLKMVDVFLDTYPYNAHSLAADAVSAGVPLVTLVGNSFASRVAGSLNAFLGTSELNAYCPSEYIANAVGLAKDAQRRSILRVQLLQRVSEISWGSAYAADFEEKILINEVLSRA